MYFQFSNLSNFQIVSVDRLKPDFLEIMFVALLFEEHGSPEITGAGYQKTSAEKSTPAFALLCNLEILHSIIVEEIADDHLGLCSAISVRFVRETDVYTGIKEGG
jgi:hypothetical protein